MALSLASIRWGKASCSLLLYLQVGGALSARANFGTDSFGSAGFPAARPAAWRGKFHDFMTERNGLTRQDPESHARFFLDPSKQRPWRPPRIGPGIPVNAPRSRPGLNSRRSSGDITGGFSLCTPLPQLPPPEHATYYSNADFCCSRPLLTLLCRRFLSLRFACHNSRGPGTPQAPLSWLLSAFFLTVLPPHPVSARRLPSRPVLETGNPRPPNYYE